MNIETGTWIAADGTTEGTWEHDTLESAGSWTLSDGTSGGFDLDDDSEVSGSWWIDSDSIEGTW